MAISCAVPFGRNIRRECGRRELSILHFKNTWMILTGSDLTCSRGLIGWFQGISMILTLKCPRCHKNIEIKAIWRQNIQRRPGLIETYCIRCREKREERGIKNNIY